MPKATLPQLPLSAVFGITKPSGPTSMAVLDDLKRLFSASRLFVDYKSAEINGEVVYSRKIHSQKSEHEKKWGKGLRKKGCQKKHVPSAKVGQGGTLDPLADGVLVVGVNKGTKELSGFLDCVKEYRTTCLVGYETDTYDSEGTQVREAPWRHITREKVEAALQQFRGEIQQTPPIFSALKMNGKPLYEYARSGTPLPRPIERRKVTVHSLELTHWIPGSAHSFRFPEKKFTDEEREKMQNALRGVEIPADAAIKDEPEPPPSQSEAKVEAEAGAAAESVPAPASLDDEQIDDKSRMHGPPAFVLSMRVSSGTYVRSIVHDLGLALGSAAHVVTLTRSRQGRFVLPSDAAVQTPSAPAAASATITPSSATTAPLSSTATEEKPSDGADLKGEEETLDEEKLRVEEQDQLSIPWDVFLRGLENGAEEKPDSEGWREWEREVMARMEIIEVGSKD